MDISLKMSSGTEKGHLSSKIRVKTSERKRPLAFLQKHMI